MKLPISWLNDYVKVDDIAPSELAEKLTRAGLQVEAVETVGGNPLSDLIVVVEVLECEAHPNSDHLHVCKVTDGKETFQVVCGAPNMRKWDKDSLCEDRRPDSRIPRQERQPREDQEGQVARGRVLRDVL